MNLNRRFFLRATGATATLTALTAYAKTTEKPNILWITSEDNNLSWIGCYGNKDANTPNIDQLAKDGFRYTQCYSNGAVCSATRSSWITGMYSPTVGIQNHRSRVEIPASIPLYPEQLKAAGYYVANHVKQDYNIVSNRLEGLWNSKSDDWKKADGKPFFQVINLVQSHESRLFGAKLKKGRKLLSDISAYEGFEHDPKKLELHKYHPNLPGIRATYARYYDCIRRMDETLGKILKRLEADGLAENTIVIHNSDHGGVLPRGKRYMYNSGTHCPLIVRIPKKYKALWPAQKSGQVVDRLVSFLDMPKTWIDLAGGTPPKPMQGRIFLGPNQEPEPQWHFSYRGRNDARVEFVRAVRDKKYLYVRNYYPFVPRGQYVDYQWNILAQREWAAANQSGQCDAITGRYFLPRGMDELYDTQNDPDCIKNLVQNPEQRQRIKIMRSQLKNHLSSTRDIGFVPESDMLKRARNHNATVYEIGQNPKRYDFNNCLGMADLSIENNPAHVKTFIKGLRHSDSGVRYWAAIGCMALGQEARSAKSPLVKALDDSSHLVRTMAAWALIKQGEKKKGYACIEQLMVEKESYAELEIHNVIDWMGEDGKPLIATMRAIPRYEKLQKRRGSFQLVTYLFGKYTEV